MICASSKFLDKQPTKLSLGLASLLEIDTSFVRALTSSHGLEGRAAPIEIQSYFYSRASKVRTQVLNYQLIIQIQIN